MCRMSFLLSSEMVGDSLIFSPSRAVHAAKFVLRRTGICLLRTLLIEGDRIERVVDSKCVCVLVVACLSARLSYHVLSRVLHL